MTSYSDPMMKKANAAQRLEDPAEAGFAGRSHTAGRACVLEEGGPWGKHGFPHVAR